MSTSSHGSSVRAIFYAFLANLGIALAKSGAAFYTGSGSMLAEAIHSFADCGNQVLLYIGLRQSGKPADADAAVLNIITVQFGPHIMLAAKIRMYPGIPIEQAVVRLDELERKLKQEQPDIRWCFLEPDIEKGVAT
jgi:divalent metal cation (Fe/Co/Zn/Cd) transporter